MKYYLFKINNLIKLDLTICKNKKAEISIPVSINDNIDKFNSRGGYYNDICYTTKSDYNTDICLDDRRREFINKNLTLCEEDCNLIDYDYINEKAKCSRIIKLNTFDRADYKYNCSYRSYEVF